MFHISLSFLVCIIISNLAFSQGIYDTYNGFTVPVQINLPSNEVHPALWFQSAGITDLKNKKNQDAYALTLWKRVDSVISKYQSQTPSATTFNTRPIMAKLLAFSWLMKGDTVARRKAIDCLMLAYGNVPRTATSANFSDAYDEIYRATWIQNYCAAYDWMKPSLTVAQDTAIRNLIAAEAVLLRNNMVAGVKYAPRPHNHRSKPAWGLVTAALTLSSDARANDWLQFGLTQANTVTKYMFSADGLYREGSHYFLYSAVNFIPYLWQLKEVTGAGHFTYYKPVFEMIVKLRNSKGWLPCIEDSYVKPFPTDMVAGAYKNTQTELHQSASLASVLQWHWNETSFFTLGYTGASDDVTWELDEYLTYDPTVAASAPTYNGSIKTNSGTVLMRDSAGLGVKPSRYLLFNGVAECDNHQHADLLSYIMEYNGTILSCDPGYGKDGFSDAKRDWYISANAHNTLMAKGSAPLDWSDNKGPIDKYFLDAPWLTLSEKSAKTAAVNGTLIRGIAFIDKKFWIVYDAAASAASTSYLLNIHSRGAANITGNKAVWQTATDKYGSEQKMMSVVASSATAVYSVKNGYTSLFKDEVAQQYLEAAVTDDSVAFIHLVYPSSVAGQFPNVVGYTQNAIPVIEFRSTPKQLCFINNRNTAADIGPVGSDAVFTHVQYDTVTQAVKQFTLTNAKSLSFTGGVIFSADKPVTISGDRTETWVNKFILDTVKTATVVKIAPSFSTDSTITVTFNGTVVPHAIVNKMVVVTVQGNGLLIIKSGTVGMRGPHKNKNSGVKTFSVIGNYPNPFNNATRIRLLVPERSPLKLSIHTALGEQVRTYALDDVSGELDMFWDGKNEAGEVLPSGMYLIAATNGKQVIANKCLMMK